MRFSWDILEMRNTGGVVTQVWFRLTGREGGEEQSLQGSVRLPPPPASAGAGRAKFTDYAQLTKKQVVNWVKGHPAAEGFRKRVADALQEQEPAEQPTNAPLPWSA